MSKNLQETEAKLSELSKRMTALNRAIHLKECELNSLRYQYANCAKKFWAAKDDISSPNTVNSLQPKA